MAGSNLDELKQAFSEALGVGEVTERHGANTITLICELEPGEPSCEVYVERMADGYQLTQSPDLPERINHAITIANERTGAAITRPEKADSQPPATASRPPEEAPKHSGPAHRPPGPSLAGIGGSWD